jgi:hypothetical protein
MSPGKNLAKNTPPLLFPQKFSNQKSGWVAGGVGPGPWRRRGGYGWFRRTPGRVVNGGNFFKKSFLGKNSLCDGTGPKIFIWKIQKKREFYGFILGKRNPQNHFFTAVAEVAA